MPDPTSSGRSMPTQIARYRITQRIGRGAMGVVYAAHDEKMDRPVALKVLIGDLESVPETRERFYREARATARLRHQNVVTVYDAGEADGRSYIAMELLDGLPLESYLRKPEAQSLDRKLDLMIQMCEGLAAAHAHDIVHRDLKPNNLFVQSDGLLKVLDFGVARLADSSMTADGQLIGTPQYMAPEQARGQVVDQRSDIFSAGGVFYFMLSGRQPFPGPELAALLRQLQFEELEPLPAVPPELFALVSQAMAKDPAERPSRVEELLAGLVRFRRQYLNETRRLAATARAQYDNARQLVMAIADAKLALGMPADAEPAEALERLAEQHPQVTARGAGDGSAVDRERVDFLLRALEGKRAELSDALESIRGHRAQFEAGERALASGDARAALRQFEAVMAACPSSTRAHHLAEMVRPLAKDQEDRERHHAELLRSARIAMDENRWPDTVAICREVLAELPNDERALALLNEAERAITHEQRRIELTVQPIIERAAHAIDRHDFADADAAIARAEEIQPGSPAVASLRRRLAEVRAAVEAAEILRQLSEDEIRRARAAFRRGRYDEAVQQLRGFLEVESQANEVREELAQLIALRERIARQAAASRPRIQDCIREANVLLHRQQFDAAVAVAQEALQLDPIDTDAVATLDEICARSLAQRIAAARARDLETRTELVEPLLASARGAVERGYLAAALRAALAAQRLAPEREDVPALIEELHDALAQDDQVAFDVGDVPFPEPPPAPVPETVPEPAVGPAAIAPSPSGGVFAQVNHWASDLFRRWPAKG